MDGPQGGPAGAPAEPAGDACAAAAAAAPIANAADAGTAPAPAPATPFDAPLPFRAEGLAPGAGVAIALEARDATGLLWTGAATAAADVAGRLALDLGPAVALMAPADVAALHARLVAAPEHGPRPALDPAGGLSVTARLEAPSHARSLRLRRLALTPGVLAETVAEGADLRGVLYRPAEGPLRGGVLLLAGSGGGIDGLAGALLARHGYGVLAQALFAHADLPPHMENLPLERIGRGLDWLSARCGGRPVALRGISKGSEGAVLAALAWPQHVGALILWVPSPMATTGRGAAPGPRPLFTRGGAPLPHGVPPFPEGFGADPSTPDRPVELNPIFQRMWTDPANDRFRFPVERLRCPLLLVSAGDDRIWPSALAARQMAARARAGGVPVRHVENPDAGHGLNLPGLPSGAAHLSHHPRQRTWLAMGGTPAGNAAGAARGWQALLETLDAMTGEGRAA